MGASNLRELERMLRKEMMLAMEELSARSLDIMEDETEGFYAGGTPKLYTRTGALGRTPKTRTSYGGNSASLEAYLDQSGGYTTGDRPSMTNVLLLADRGSAWTTKSGAMARPTVGRKGFWERADERIMQEAEIVFSNHFG